MRCPKCNSIMLPNNTFDEWQCLRCGFYMSNPPPFAGDTFSYDEDDNYG